MSRLWAGLVLMAVIASGFAVKDDSLSAPIPAAEFSNIVKSFSEEEGYFFSDNLISNEDGYLNVIDKLRELHVSGGAYIGVGPEQNFTYIAKLRPAIAFLVDIRREAMIQHLMYKALFHLSENRTEFLSRLLSRRLTGKNAPNAKSSVRALTDYFGDMPGDASYYAATLAEIERAIQSDFKFQLSDDDKDALKHIFISFYADGLDVSFKFNSFRGGRGGGRFSMPSLRDLIEQTDLSGKPGNFLANADEYQFVRSLHEKNRIIPIVGDFAGPKAFKAIAGYLRKHAYPVKVFYTSNVEMYLFESGSFGDFVENVKALPTVSGSLFIRSAQSNYVEESRINRMVTLLQYISVFLKDQKKDLYPDYWTLVNTHTIPTTTLNLR
jgi:hypothetical protein